MDRRKQLREQYKARKVVGGVYRIRNTTTNRFYLQSTDDIQGTRNWFQFSCATNSCTLPPIREDWAASGSAAFVLEELDLLEKTEQQTTEEFRGDIRVLLELWDEKLPKENRY